MRSKLQSRCSRFHLVILSILALSLLMVSPIRAHAQNCLGESDLDPATKSALETAAQRYFDMSVRADYAGLRDHAIASLASNFNGVEKALTDHRADFTGARNTMASLYVLEQPGGAATGEARFFCGIFNSPDRITFIVPNLPPGRFAVITQSASGGKTPVALTLVLQQERGAWKLAGYTVRANEIGGHDAQWYLTKAREYKGRQQNVAAYLYYLQAWEMAAPVSFAYTVQRDKIVDEMQSAKPAEWPTASNPLNLTAGGKTYRVTQIFADSVGSDLDLIVKYAAVSDVSNTSAAFQDNMAVIRGVVERYPELRQAFAGVVARAVDASGRDYGSLLAMKDVK
jgi:hypothetical protein